MKRFFVFAVAMMMTLAFALPVTAQDKAEWSFYGQVRMWTAWESVDSDTPPQLASTGAPGSFFTVGTTKARAFTYGTELKDDDEIAWLLQSNSRIGANVKWGNIGGRFEYSSAPGLRLLYGTWNFGPGTLLVGQDYGSYFYLVSSICGVGGAECNGIGFGSIYSGRTPQLKLIMGGFKVNLSTATSVASFQPIDPTVTAVTSQTLLLRNNQTTAGTGFTDTDLQLPKIEASYTFNLGPAQLFIGGVYNKYTEVYNIGNLEIENDVDGWALGIGTRMGFGPFYANATLQIATNPNNSGSGPATLYPSVQLYNPALNNSEDADYIAGQLILGFKLSDSMSFEGGVIWQSGEVDSLVAGRGSIEQDTWTYYLQMAWSPAKNVFIVPEIGMIDYDELQTGIGTVPYGKTKWAGIKWQINF